MNFAIKTSSISKKHFTDGNTKSANELTPLKQTEYIETLETRVSMLENENSELRKEVEFLKNRLNKGYNRGMPKTTKVGQIRVTDESQRITQLPLKQSQQRYTRNEEEFEDVSDDNSLSNTDTHKFHGDSTSVSAGISTLSKLRETTEHEDPINPSRNLTSEFHKIAAAN